MLSRLASLSIRPVRSRSARLPAPLRTYANSRDNSKTGRPAVPRTPDQINNYKQKYDWADGKDFVQRKPGSPQVVKTVRQQQSRPAAQAKAQTPPEISQYSQRQPESDETATPGRNPAPSSTGGGPGRTTKASAKAQPAADYSDAQDELQGPKTAEANKNTTSSADSSNEGPIGSSKPLPDLRHGIPSTFAEEFMNKAESKHNATEQDPENITQDPNNPSSPPGSGGRGGGELPKTAYETSTDRRRNRTANYGALAAALLGVAGGLYYGRNWDTPEEEATHPEAPSGWELGLFWKRIQARWGNQLSYYTEPVFPKLLPTIDPAPPYTLVLSLEDLLIHSEWSRDHGWRTAKRPGLDYFLRYLSQYYEIVIFTTLPSTAAEAIIAKLDPIRLVIMWPLFREATRYENGEYIKDLSYLNRDLSKTILIDTKAVHAKVQPENAIILPPWDGKPADQGLVGLIPFLEYIAAMGIPDVRQAIKSFEGKDIPTEFARRESVQREAFNKQLEEERAKKPKLAIGSVLSSALGLKPQGGLQFEEGQSAAEGFAQGKMLSDQARERGQRQYMAMEKEIQENSEKWMKELEAEQKRMQDEYVKGMKSKVTFGSMFGFGNSTPEEAAKGLDEKK